MTTTPHAELLTEPEIMGFAFDQRFKDGPSYIISVVRAAERALLARLGEQQPVVVIGRDWQLLWASGEDLSDIVKRHGLKIGTKLYAHPPAAQHVAQGEREAFETWLDGPADGVRGDVATRRMTLTDEQQDFARMGRQASRSSAQGAAQVPAGWRLVPVEPTISILVAGHEARISERHPEHFQAAYAAMLSAAPLPAASHGEGER